MASLTHGTRRIVLALFSTCCLYTPFWMIQSFNSTDYIWFTGTFLATLIIGLIPGWGSWFLVGRNPDSYKHNKDWIIAEYLAKKLYGPKDSLRRDIFEWRRKREIFAMGIRGLNFTIAAPLIFALHLYFQYDYKLYGLLLLAPTGYIFGYLYEIGHLIDTSKFPKWMRGSTELGEILAGATIMSSFLMIGAYFNLKG